MMRRLKYWKVYLLVAGILYLLVLARCHFVPLPMRKADAVMELKLTGYCACARCCGWKYNWCGLPIYASGPLKDKFKIIGQTASGKMARPGTVAVDPKVFPRGTRFYIPGYGWGVAHDVGGDIQGHHLDLFFWTHHFAEAWGVQNSSVKVWYPQD
ncbi:MAG: 3D domain-containing protein [Kiritimatiellaceae bacterium]|nr:3D domain-containing protein [Kiritimatiellaceae bacterium]